MSSDFVTISVADKPFKLSKAFFPSEKAGSRLIVDTSNVTFTDKNGLADVQKFLSALAAIPAAQRFVQTKALIDGLVPANFEAIADLLLSINFHFPNKFKPVAAQEIAWPEYLLEKLPICLDAKLLANHCRAYKWYVAASRRVVTIAHMSSTGLTKDFLRFVNRLTKEDPALAFALSPTTLHDNTLVAPKTARYFTCSPFGQDFSSSDNNSDKKISQFDPRDVTTDYKPLFLDEKSSHVKLGTVNKMESNQAKRKETAKTRLDHELKGLNDKSGFFPWFHPTRPDTGVLLAGGLPCAVTLDEAKWQLISKTTDIDLFVYGDTEEDRKDMTRIVLEHLESLGGKISHFVSVFKVDGLGREIQVVCPYARSPLGVLINFDSTFIQIGYQDGEFIATPGHCFFTPRSETLITRYNVRFHRMLKAIERGFMPVSDARGHLMYPTKTVFSSRWPFALSASKPLDEEWVLERARDAYIIAKKIDTSHYDSSLQAPVINDKELFDVLLEEFREKAKDSNAKESVTMSVYDPLKLNGTAKEKKDAMVTICRLKTSKPHIEWIATTTEEAMKTFHPQGATLSNGFDIYTAGVNSTLPIPEDGDTEGIYIGHVLLRNVKVVPASTSDKGKKTYNLAAPKDKPLTVEHQPFVDTDSKYPDRESRFMNAGKEPVREIEGIFLFGDIKDPKMLETDFKAHVERREANAKKLKTFAEKKQQARFARFSEERAKRRALEDQRRAVKGLPTLAEQAELDHKALEARRKLQQAKREAAIAKKNAKEGKSVKKQTAVVVEEPQPWAPKKAAPAFVIDGLEFNHPDWHTFTDKQKNLVIDVANRMLVATKNGPLTAESVRAVVKSGLSDNEYSPKPIGERELSIAKTFNDGLANHRSKSSGRPNINLSDVNVPPPKEKEELHDVEAVGPNAKRTEIGCGYFIAGETAFPAPHDWNQLTDAQRDDIIKLATGIVELDGNNKITAARAAEIAAMICRQVPAVSRPAPPATKTIPVKKTADELLREAKKAKEIETAAREKEERSKKDFSLRSTIDFGDLHRYMAEPAKLVTIGVHELPMLYKAFSNGGNEYTTISKEVIKRSDGMVKVRAPVAFSDCLIFDVDDLFVATKSVDSHPERRYNAVVHLANLERWIIKAHEHKDVITSSSSRELIMAALQEELNKEDQVGKMANAPVAEFMRALRHVANTKDFEDKANKAACSKPHAHPGLPGEMPTLFVSRLYVSKV